MRFASTVRAAIAALLLWAASCALAPAQAVNQDSLLVVDFESRVDNYMKLRQQALSDVHPLKPTDSPREIAEQQRHLAHRIREARERTGQGALFTPAASDLFRRLIAANFQGGDAAQIRASLRRAAPVPPLRLRVNHQYPKSLPLQSTPPSLLLNLPRLPQELEYRIVGRDLILLDVKADLVVDYLPGALPPP